MKSSEEMVNSLLERRKHYIARQKQRRTAVVRAITCMCCVCFMAILSFGVYRAVFFNIQEPSTTISADANETVDRPSSDDLNDVLNYVIIWDDNICDENPKTPHSLTLECCLDHHLIHWNRYYLDTMHLKRFYQAHHLVKKKLPSSHCKQRHYI